jgi:hypothetical protein
MHLRSLLVYRSTDSVSATKATDISACCLKPRQKALVLRGSERVDRLPPGLRGDRSSRGDGSAKKIAVRGLNAGNAKGAIAEDFMKF